MRVTRIQPPVRWRCARCPGVGAGRRHKSIRGLDRMSADNAAAQDGGNPAGFPRRFGDFELLGEVARGGMGIVFRARQLSLNRLVALKMIRDGALATPKAIQRFRLEAETAATLGHPNIVPIHGFGEVDGHWFLSMALIEGEDLSAGMKGVPMDPQPLAGLMVQLARAIHYAHQHGVLHRDLKPSNIMLDGRGQPYVTDFGLAKFTDDAGSATHSVEIVGSPNYMAPEQVSGEASQLTTATDIYSLGAVMYELLCGRAPFRAATPLEVLRKVVGEEPQRPRELYRFASPDLETICLKCLQKDPARRYGSAEALAEDLERWLTHRPIRARPVGTLERVLKWGQRNPRLATAVVLLHVVVGLALGTGVWMGYRIARANERLAEAAEEGRRRNLELVRTAEESRRRLVRLNVQTGDRLVAEGDGLGALPWFIEALRLDEADPVRASLHRYRIGSVARQAPQLQQLWFHEGLVQGAVFSPDGSRVATATYGGATRIWDAVTGRPVGEPIPSEASVVEFSPDGTRLATLTMSHKARVWDAATGRPMTPPMNGPGGSCYYLFAHAHFSPDGTRLATAAGGPSAHVWDARTGAMLVTLHHAKPIHELAWSPDGRRLISAGEDKVVLMWEAEDGTPVGKALVHEGPVWGASFSPDGRRILTHSWRPSALRVWDAATREPVTPWLRAGGSMHASAFSRDGQRVMGAFQGGGAAVWEVPGGRQVRAVQHPVGCRFAALSPDGERLATAGFDKSARVWDVQTGRPLTPVLHHQGIVNTLSWSPDGERLVTASDDGTARMWDLSAVHRSGRQLLQKVAATQVVFGSGERLIAAACKDGAARLFRVADGALAVPELRHGASVSSVMFDPAGDRLLTASEDGTARLWEVATGRESPEAMKHPAPVMSAVFSPDGHWVATACSDGHSRLWESRTGRELRTLPDPQRSGRESGGLTKVLFSPDGKFLVAAGVDGVVRVWDPASGTLVRQLRHSPGVVDLAFSLDGRRLVASVWDGAPTALYAQAWEVGTWEPSGPPMKFSDGVYQSAFSPDGGRVVSAAEDSQAVIWDLATSRPAAPPLRHEHSVRHAVFSADGRRVLTASSDGTVRIWDAASGESLAQPLPHGGVVYQALFSREGDRVVTAAADGVRLWELPPHRGEPDDLLLETQVAAGERLDPVAGLVPLEGEELRPLWEKLRERRRSKESR